MMKKVINVLTLIALLNQVTYVFGKLTAIRASRNLYDDTKVICVSEDDGGALIWNYIANIDVQMTNTNFRSVCNFVKRYIDCKMNNDKGCLELWDRKGWELTNSMDTFMGPVLDQRWEGFKEQRLNDHINLNNKNIIMIPFSVLALRMITIQICSEENEPRLCYILKIFGPTRNIFIITKCRRECVVGASAEHSELSSHRWETFVLTWNSVTRSISLYNLDQLIISFEDWEKDENSNIFSKIIFSTPKTRRLSSLSIVRYHNYTFLFTRQQRSTLTSPEFFIGDNGICLQLLIGLCEVCDAIIVLNDVIGMKIGSIRINGSWSIHGFPTWQSVIIKSNVSSFSYNKVKLAVIPRLRLSTYDESRLMWAVATVRECPPKGCLRIYENVIEERYPPDSVTCQKLFYNEKSTVRLLSNVEQDTELDDANCDLGYIGPDCSLICEKILGRDENCKGVAICNTKGCTCPPGFRGPNCLTPCNEGLYGHACSKKCGSCLHNKCGSTGICATNCENNANYTYIPPMCQIRVFKPGEPEIVFLSRTTVVATVRFKWEEKYKKEKLFYSFRIKTLDERFVYEQDKKQIFENTTQLIGIFEGLKFDTSYRIICILFTGQLEISSNWKTVEIDCILPHAPQNFTYSLDSNGAVDFKWLYPKKTCGHDLCCFRIIIQKISSNLRSNASRLFENKALENSVTYDTHDYKKRLNLLPSTLYNISIQTMTINNETGNTKSFQFQTSASVGLNGDVGISMQKSDALIVLRIPKVLNDTSDSMTYIIIIGQDICEQNIDLSKNLLEHIDKYKTEHVWQIVKRPTDELANKVFNINDNHNGKCILKNGDLCEIMIIITEIKSLNETVIFKYNKLFYFGGPPPTYYEVWFIGVILLFAAISAAFYFYKK